VGGSSKVLKYETGQAADRRSSQFRGIPSGSANMELMCLQFSYTFVDGNPRTIDT